jgi:hypothetical protein
MTKQEREIYQDTKELRKVIENLRGMKFRLDCGHHVTFGFFLGNDVTVLNGKRPRIICSECGY